MEKKIFPTEEIDVERVGGWPFALLREVHMAGPQDKKGQSSMSRG